MASTIALQAQVPTTADKPPQLKEYNGQMYFDVETTGGSTIQLVPSSGFTWIKCKATDSSGTPGVINYLLYGRPAKGQIILQAQVPTTADKPPQLKEYNGQVYIDVETTGGSSVQLVPSSGFTWNTLKATNSSNTPGVINYLLYGRLV